MKRLVLSSVLAVGALLWAGPLSAATLVYDVAGNPGWGGATAWSGGVWVDDNTASFTSATDLGVSNTANRALEGLENLGAGTVTITGTGATDFLTFSGGSLNAVGDVTLSTATRLAGNFTKTGAGTLTFDNNSGSEAAYAGTATIDAGTLSVIEQQDLGTSSNITVNSGGTFETGGGSTEFDKVMGALVVNGGGTFIAGGLSNDVTNLTVSSLSGSGTITPGGANNRARLFTVNQATDTTFSGTMNGLGAGNQKLRLFKQGAGNLTLTGDVGGTASFGTTTLVEAGGLYIDTTNTGLGNGDAGSGAQYPGTAGVAVQVQDGGTLGGSGTINTTGGDGVQVDAGGSLAPGSLDAVGRLTLNFGGGGILDLTAISSGALLFDLGSDAAAGTTYDQISLTAGTVDFGVGTLELSDFTFNILAGFGQGTYTLFDTVGFTGTVDGATGTVGGLSAFLSTSGNDVLLTVVPEPGTILYLLVAGLIGSLLLRRRLRAR